MIIGLDNKVQLEPIAHKYFHTETGVEYTSVSKFLSYFYEAFDAQRMSKGDVNLQKQWKDYGQKRADAGTRIHEALERYEKSTQILPEDEDLRPGILSVTREYTGFYRIMNEQTLYNTEMKIAGTSDKVLLTSSHKSCVVDIDDYKTNLKELCQVDLDKEGKRQHKYLLGPVSHLIDSKLNRYILQLSTYAWLLQKKTFLETGVERKIGQLGIRYIPPNDMLGHYRIPVAYMKLEVEAMMQWYKINVLDKPEVILKPLPKVKKEYTFEEEEF